MAPKASVPKEVPAQFLPDRFQIIQTTISRRDIIRDPAGAQAVPTGYVRFNTSASESARQQCGALFSDMSKCGILWGADETTGEIAGCFVPPTVAGVIGIREYKDGLIGSSLRGLYQEKPALRPETRKWVSVTFHAEEGKYPYFVLHMNIALPQIKQRRKSSGKKKKAEQIKVEQGKAEQTKAEQNKPEQKQAGV